MSRKEKFELPYRAPRDGGPIKLVKNRIAGMPPVSTAGPSTLPLGSVLIPLPLGHSRILLGDTYGRSTSF